MKELVSGLVDQVAQLLGVKKRKSIGTSDESKDVAAHDKGNLYPWVMYAAKYPKTNNWVVGTHRDTHKCLQSREIKHYTYKFLAKQICDQVKVNTQIPAKAAQDRL